MTDFALTDTARVDDTVRLAAAGDEAALARLIHAHHASMAKVAFVVCGDAELTRDAVQAAWGTAWRRLRDVRDPERIRGWLLTIAANEARQAMRRQRRAVIVDISAVPEPVGAADPAEGVDAVDLARALRGLKPDDRTLLALRFVAGLDSTEIAAQLGGSPSGVRSRLSRLIDRLRDDLGVREAAR
jgi:RNA polymerase sigma-70 factor (ECF subfamily)